MEMCEDAIACSRKAQEIFLKIDDWIALSWTYMVFGIAYKVKKEWNRAEDSFQRALDVIADMNTPFYLAQIHYEYGCMLFEKALAHLAEIQNETELHQAGEGPAGRLHSNSSTEFKEMNKQIEERAKITMVRIEKIIDDSKRNLTKSMELFETLGANLHIQKVLKKLEEISSVLKRNSN
ncbi:MAG: hypothetical protein QW728_03645, partial [Thermoplasmata archaeon]